MENNASGKPGNVSIFSPTPMGIVPPHLQRTGQPRPVVRPSAPPVKVMPQTPAPPQLNRFRNPSTSAASFAITPSVDLAVPVFGLLAMNSVPADSPLYSEVSSLQSSLSDLQNRSSFKDITSDVAELDSAVNRATELIESARSEGYCYQKDLDGKLYDALSRWQASRPQVVEAIQRQAKGVQPNLATLNFAIQQLNTTLYNPVAATPVLRSLQSSVNNLLQQVSATEQNLRRSYSGIESQIGEINTSLNNIHWALDQLSAAKFSLESSEALVMAVASRWDKEGKDDPEGVLYLTNKQLVFERKEKVATKKILFITTASELVQEVIINQPLGNLKEIKAENKGLFGNQDFLLVQFTDPKLGRVAFHLKGQDSKYWASLVERARSGQIDAERVEAGAGLTISDLTKPLTTGDVMALQSEVNSLQDEMMLRAARQELSSLENEVHSLARKVTGLRDRGYVTEKDLEADAIILATQWDRVKANASVTLDAQTRLLGEQMSTIQQKLAQLVGMSGNLEVARSLYMQIKSAVASAQAQSGAAQALVLVQYDQYEEEVQTLSAHLDWINWMLDALATASFRLQATESGIAATEAIFQQTGWEPENGILFLTDQRVLWEDRVGDYELKVNVPFQEVLDVQKEVDEQKGRDDLVFKFGAQAPVPIARFELALPVADNWLKMVGRARADGYAQDRAIPVSEADLERVRNAPQQCSKCGAVFTAPILRGQNEINCEYCGLVTRI